MDAPHARRINVRFGPDRPVSVLVGGRRGNYESVLHYLIFERERRQILVDGLETHQHADAKLLELVEADPEAEGNLVLIGQLERERTG